MGVMKSPEWHQRVLLLTSDAEVRGQIKSAFGAETEFWCEQDSHKGVERIEQLPLDVLIIDGDLTDSHKVADEISFLEFSQYATQLNHKLAIIVLINKLLSKQADFAQKCGATAIMDRKDISIEAMLHLIGILRKRTFRTVLCRDVLKNQVLPVDLFHYLPLSNHYVVFLAAGTPFTEDKREKVLNSHVRHLYVKEGECEQLLNVLSQNGSKQTVSEGLHKARQMYQELMREFFNFGSNGMISVGQRMMTEALEIVFILAELVQKFPDFRTCLAELPFPRWSPLAHGLNTAIYAQIFSKFCGVPDVSELTVAALFHNLGLAYVKQNILKKSEFELAVVEKREYESHVFKSIEIIKRKAIALGDSVESAILYHHENYDGTGFPDHKRGNTIPEGARFLSLLGAFDYYNTVRPGESVPDLTNSWERLKAASYAANPKGVKFDPMIISQLDMFFE